MSRRVAATVIAVATAVVVLGAWLLLREPTGSGSVEVGVSEPAAVPDAPEAESAEVTLYFPGADRRLHPQPVQLVLDGSVEQRVAVIVEALLVGPEEEGFLPALPAGTRLLGVIRGHEGEVYVNLEAPAETEALAVGSAQELAWVYSVVDTVALNLEEVRSVGLLWSNRQPPTLSGHVDTTAPLLPKPGLVAAAPAAGG